MLWTKTTALIEGTKYYSGGTQEVYAALLLIRGFWLSSTIHILVLRYIEDTTHRVQYGRGWSVHWYTRVYISTVKVASNTWFPNFRSMG